MTRTMPELITTPVAFAKLIVSETVSSGDIAVDATAGNGKDTELLAELVGEVGHVHAFDVQDKAIERTRARLNERGLLDRVTLHQTGHENLGRTLPAALRGLVTAVMFNLGFLPGSKHSVITSRETSIAALSAALGVLAPGGVITIVCYTGHPGAQEEALAVTQWCQNLNYPTHRVLLYEPANKPGPPIRLYAVHSIRK